MALNILLYRFIAACGLIVSSPFLAVACVAVKLDSPGPFIFTQKRAGKNRKPFTLYKIRTMVYDAEQKKRLLMGKNEADGPVFKIRNDPRYTRVGKLLSHIGLDELPQLVNVMKGEMSFVGPRPLPVEEAAGVPKKYEARFRVLPGMTSEWILRGAHKLTFDQWMRLDLSYVKHASFSKDLSIMGRTVFLICRWVAGV